MADEQIALLIEARESISAARFLLEGGYAKYAASRAYYSMLYVAYALLGNESMPLSEESKVVAAFGEVVHAGKVSIEFHQFLIEAHALRIAVDEKCASLIPEEAEEQIAHAEQFLELAERLIGPIPTEE